MKRIPFIAGNWKMHKNVEEAVELAEGLKKSLGDVPESRMELAVCPPALDLYAVSEALEGSNIGVGAQNIYWEDAGAYTGENSPAVVDDLAEYTIIGHSERRQYFGETDETVNKKIKAALKHGLTPIVCVGESLEQNEAGETVEFVGSQMRGAFEGLSAEDARQIVLAYEPIWAIGTGRTATPEDANRIIREAIRDVLKEMYDEETADSIRVQYGGSVKPHNSAEFLVMEEIDGALVGGASLKVDTFTDLVKNALGALEKLD
jgi:triosephosphate isomerase